jgi:1,4-alpha-glucan branching enzyme
MLLKKYSKDGKNCTVTFVLPAQIKAKTAHLYGDFTDWEESPKLMVRQENGSFTTKMKFPAGNSYRFRYLLDGEHWENDWAADAYAPNPFGTEDSVVNV